MRSIDAVNRNELEKRFNRAVDQGQSMMIGLIRDDDPVLDFAQCVCNGLERRQRRLECRFLYDAEGSELYESITKQPEYYLTRTEAAIMSEHAAGLPDITGSVTLIELGSGSSTKTRHLLNAYTDQEDELFYVPIDVSRSALHDAAETIINRYPMVRVIGIHGIYEDALGLIPGSSPAMLIFLGSTMGNLNDEETENFLRRVSNNLTYQDYFLLGVDLVKDASVIEAAYNDAAGVTRKFTRNLFSRMNRELGSSLDTDSIRHVAQFNTELNQVEIHAEFTRAQEVYVKQFDRKYSIEEGERILVEISRKFVLEEVSQLLMSHGLAAREVFTDADEMFALILSQREGCN